MKKLTKTTALILSALMLFGCADNNARSGAGDTTPPTESSVTESKSESKQENSFADNKSEDQDKSDNNGFVKNAEGYQTFSYEKDKYLVTSPTIFRKKEASTEINMNPYDPQPSNICDLILHQPVAVKCRIAGESIYFNKKNQSGDVTVKNSNEGYDYLLGVFTPVVVEEIIDSFSYNPDFKSGDTIYVYEEYAITKDFADYCEQDDARNVYAVKLFERYISNCKSDLETELKKGDSADNKVIEEIKKQIEEYEQNIEKTKSYEKYVAENEKTVLTLISGFPMQKDKSYFAYVNATKIEGTTDNNSYYFSYCEKYNLGDDEPESLGEEEKYVSFHYTYECSWNYLRKKYGDHFKS